MQDSSPQEHLFGLLSNAKTEAKDFLLFTTDNHSLLWQKNTILHWKKAEKIIMEE